MRILTISNLNVFDTFMVNSSFITGMDSCSHFSPVHSKQIFSILCENNKFDKKIIQMYIKTVAIKCFFLFICHTKFSVYDMFTLGFYIIFCIFIYQLFHHMCKPNFLFPCELWGTLKFQTEILFII